MFFYFKDILELFVIFLLVDRFITWISKDLFLLKYFYIYLFILISCYYLDFTILNFILLYFSPVIIVFFVIFHERSLQKNFVLIKSKNGNNLDNIWIQELIKAILFAINNRKDFVCVIERDDDIKKFIKTKCLFHSDFKQDIFEILLEKQFNNSNYFIWVNNKGKLIAINCNWLFNKDENYVFEADYNISSWQKDAIFITLNSDVVIFKTNSILRNIDFIIKGKTLENLNINDSINLLKNILKDDSKEIINNQLDNNIVILKNNIKENNL